jgi:hypothetical protein
VASKVADFLTEFQARLSAVDDTAIMKKLTNDEKRMNDAANKTLLKVQQAVGLRA